MREAGFYWVKDCDVWRVYQWLSGDNSMSGRWIVPGCNIEFYYDCEFQEIDEQRITRGE